MHITLDYETFSHVNLKTAGLWSYAPHAIILCAAWHVDGKLRSMEQHGLSELVALLRRPDVVVHAWNAAFEYAITKHALKVDVPPNRWRCDMALARSFTYPAKLEHAAKALGVEQQKGDASGIRLFCGPHPPTGTKEQFKAFCEYNRQDVRAEMAVHAALPEPCLPYMEQLTWETDLRINERGVRVNLPMIEGASQLILEAKVVGSNDLLTETKGAIHSPGQQAKILAYCATRGTALANLQKPSVAAALASPATHPAVRRLLELRDALNVTSLAKYLRMMSAATGDRVHGVHFFNGADTGRWGGRIAQFQNIPRPIRTHGPETHALIAEQDADLLAVFGPLLLTLRDTLRHSIIATHKALAVSDMSAIEARVLGWLAGDQTYLDAFRGKKDLYKLTAAQIFGVPYDSVTDEQRHLGKTCILGLGYGMGIDTFERNCREKGLTVSRAMLERALRVYRETYEPIVKLWYGLEEACVMTVSSGEPHLCAGLRIDHRCGDLTIKLPSGRCLWYPQAEIKMVTNKWGKVKPSIRFMTEAVPGKWLPAHTYGGSLVENVVQAIARDLLAHALVRLEQDGMRPVMHVHDEIVCDHPDADKALAAINAYLTTKAPTWAKGLPLDSKGFTSPFYRK